MCDMYNQCHRTAHACIVVHDINHQIAQVLEYCWLWRKDTLRHSFDEGHILKIHITI